MNQHRSSTRKNYYSVWKQFNEFFIRLDNKPAEWEQRIVLFTAYLIKMKKQSSTVKSYISAMRAVLRSLKIKITDDSCLLGSLIKACKLENDRVCRLRLPIQKDMLYVLLRKTHNYFVKQGQMYLGRLYKAIIATMYFGLFRISEVTKSEHVGESVRCPIGHKQKENPVHFTLI